MEEWIKLVQTAVTTATALVALFFLGPGKYLGMQGVRFSLTSKKRKALDALIATHRWKTVSAIALEMAVRDAFGFEMDARMIRFVFLRRRALEHLRYLKKCQLMLKVSEDGSILEPARPQRSSFRSQGIKVFVIALVPIVLLMVLAPLLKTLMPTGVLGMMCGFAFAWMPVMMWMSDGLETAHRLTVGSSHFYPLDADVPTIPALPQ
jgi:hypothetical protein